MLIAAVIWLGAPREVEVMEVRAALGGVPAAEAMLQRIDVVGARESLENAAALVVNRGARALPIVDHGRTIGVLTERDVARGLETVGSAAPVANAPRHALISIGPDEPLDQVLERLEEEPHNVVVVLEHGNPIGIITPAQLATFAAFRAQRPQEIPGTN